MLLSLQQALPQTWRDTFQLLASGFTWTLELSKPVLDFALFGSTPWERVFKAVLIVLPCFVLVVGMMCTMASLYTLPFRSGRGGFLVAVVMSWWDWLRMTWFYWAGLLRFVLAALTGSELSGWGVSLILWPFLFILISGSFAAIQALSDAIKAKKTSQIVSMALVEGFVMFFEVMFLYRELIDAITPWISSQTGFQLGFFSTLTLASFGWVGVRAMTWFLFGRFGTPALLGILERKNIAGAHGGAAAVAPIEPDFWKGPIDALKREAEWFKKEAREVFELMSLPVLQLGAAMVNFAVVVILGHPTFTLPFRSLDQLLASTPLLSHSGKHVVPGSAA